MARWTPDPTFYPSPRMAMEAPPETYAYVSLLDPTQEERPDAIGVVDLEPGSSSYGTIVNTVEMPSPGDELHHFGWNACSAALCPSSPHPHVERRYLIVPGLRSSRIHVLDTKPDPLAPVLAKTVEGAEVERRTGYSRPHTSHCGPNGIYLSALGGGERNGNGGSPETGGLFLLDHDSFEPLGAWEVDRGSQRYSYDFWWHLAHDRLLTSEWASPDMFEHGVVPEKLLAREYGHAMHVWDLRKRSHLKALDLGDANQMVLELRPAHDPRRTYGFVGVVTNVENLAASIWLWYERDGDWAVERVIEIPAQPAAAEQLPPLLAGFGAAPALVTDINLSLDDRWLYVSCWGTGEFHQYDVSDPHQPRLTANVRLGGLVDPSSHPASGPLGGGPQMVEVSRDGKRVYVTNSLYSSWDSQFYPQGFDGWLVKLDAQPGGGLVLDSDFLVTDFEGRRPHQVRLGGGDASSDSFCFP
jgi:selenium-binding protein 1